MTIQPSDYRITDPMITESRHIRWMERAFKEARRSTFNGSRMAAIVVIGGSVISTGFNKARSGFLKSKFYTKPQAHHAEMDSILNVDPKLLRGATVYVAGYTRGGSICYSSKCCESCQKLMKSLGVKSVVFHDNIGNLYKWKVA